ncbi:hypothetical protein RchiOBHm_Chr1g0331481 [Rosa chinensis]|uniref:Uncharacterized protein n=1 Tax=Rosa chinensis TaxID=74649 RepID=A0A2P6SBJ5_ROSCH|nr:hypothetical protein RchiOBHm_Chr1g0331481 [Rosa chinensis]
MGLSKPSIYNIRSRRLVRCQKLSLAILISYWVRFSLFFVCVLKRLCI